MGNQRFAWVAGGGCLLLTLLVVGIFALLLISPLAIFDVGRSGGVAPTPQVSEQEVVAPNGEVLEAQAQIPTMTLAPGAQGGAGPTELQGVSLEALYEQLSPGVVSIQVFTQQGGQLGAGAGSGFIIDQEGHIVTNNHVVAGASDITVITFDGLQIPAEVIGTDPDSDLAVLRIDGLPDSTHPIPLGNSDEVRPGQWVVAIGNPFGLSSSMSAGIVSATGRSIPASGIVGGYSIPQVIQTDAAINPGNSGGPLLNLRGEIIGVNAQIRTAGQAANSGVGFAIPSNIVRRVVPVLIEAGSFQWSWLGISGTSVSLLIAEANDLPSQQGAYIDTVVDGGPAAGAGLRGSTGEATIDGIPVPVGGDVVTAIDDTPIASFDDLLVAVSSHAAGDVLTLTIVRGGETRQVDVTLEPRPANVDTTTFP